MTFNEKMQWLKIHNRNPKYTQMVDKYEVKQYVASRIGADFVIPNYGVWNSFDEIDFDKLPEQFVLKCTHDSGGLVICKDKSDFNYQKCRKKIISSLRKNYFYKGREWPYKGVKPRIIAEQYLQDVNCQGLNDYKFFCFNGVCKLLFIASDRFSKDEETKFDFYDREFNHLDIVNGHPCAGDIFEKPDNFETMVCIAERLSKNIPLLRVDLYNVNGKIWFGELTFTHWGGFVPFEPDCWDERLGEWLHLPEL